MTSTEPCRHEDMQTIMSNAWIDGEKLYSIRCRNCGAMTEFYFTVGECRKRFKLGIFAQVETEDQSDRLQKRKKENKE